MHGKIIRNDAVKVKEEYITFFGCSEHYREMEEFSKIHS